MSWEKIGNDRYIIKWEFIVQKLKLEFHFFDFSPLAFSTDLT